MAPAESGERTDSGSQTESADASESRGLEGGALGAPQHSGPVPPGASIVVKSGFYEGLEVCVDRAWLVIGRGRSADIVLAEPTISRSHAAVGFDGRLFFVQDLGSTNGTQLNGGSTHPAGEPRLRLKNGDVLQMGKLVVGITLPEGWG